jgi:4-hydroxythreonine-4-phosphate dehydrogenase
MPGVARSRLEGGGWPGATVVSKSGAFGAPDLLVRWWNLVQGEEGLVTVRLGLTMGDPAGIGPEIILAAARDLAARIAAGEFALVAIGTPRCFEETARRLDVGAEIVAGDDPIRWPRVPVIEAATTDVAIEPGKLSAEAGRLAYAAIERAVALATADEIDAIVTAPVSKEALHLAGYAFPGHTEILAELTGSKGSCMMLVHDRLRVSHVSTHVALADVPGRVTPERLRYVIDLTHEALCDLGFERPRIGVCALNPHAGEGGMFGREDVDVIAPVVESYRAEGMDITGPVPGDTVYVKALAGRFDAVIAMYHDQGHIVVKTLGFVMDPSSGQMSALSGVNVTLGLPIVRTSVDHGTAFDIAGKGVANAQSMVEAIEVAAQLVGARKTRNH